MPLLQPMRMEVPEGIVESLLEGELQNSKGKNLTKREAAAAAFAEKGLTIQRAAQESANILNFTDDLNMKYKVVDKILSLNGAGDDINNDKPAVNIMINFGEQNAGYRHKLMEVLIPS